MDRLDMEAAMIECGLSPISANILAEFAGLNQFCLIRRYLVMWYQFVAGIGI